MQDSLMWFESLGDVVVIEDHGTGTIDVEQVEQTGNGTKRLGKFFRVTGLKPKWTPDGMLAERPTIEAKKDDDGMGPPMVFDADSKWWCP